MKDLREVQTFMGINIHYDKINHLITLDQETYIYNIHEIFGMMNGNPVKISMGLRFYLKKNF